jgi:hypothetical protein
MPAYLLMLVRRDRASGVGDLPLGRLVADAGSAGRLRLEPLELLATAAMMLSAIVLVSDALP